MQVFKRTVVLDLTSKRGKAEEELKGRANTFVLAFVFYDGSTSVKNIFKYGVNR